MNRDLDRIDYLDVLNRCFSDELADRGWDLSYQGNGRYSAAKGNLVKLVSFIPSDAFGLGGGSRFNVVVHRCYGRFDREWVGTTHDVIEDDCCNVARKYFFNE